MTPQARTAIQRNLRTLGSTKYFFSFQTKCLIIHGGRMMANNLLPYTDFPDAEMDEISEAAQNLGYGPHGDLVMEAVK